MVTPQRVAQGKIIQSQLHMSMLSIVCCEKQKRKNEKEPMILYSKQIINTMYLKNKAP